VECQKETRFLGLWREAKLTDQLCYYYIERVPNKKMRKQTIQYTSPLDALVAVAKRLSVYEQEQKMDSEEFFDKYNRGLLADDARFIEWANDYRHYLALHQEIEQRLN